MKNRRKLSAAALLIAALLVLSACGAETAPEATPVPTEAPTAAPTETPAPTDAPTPTPSPSPTAAPTETPAPTEAPEPTEEPTPAPTPAPEVPAGVYTYYDADGGEWRLELRGDGLFTITDPDGKPHTGAGECGPTDIYFAPFAYNGGCSRWSVSGKSCTPLPRK